MGDTKATAKKGATNSVAPQGDNQAAQDAAKLAEQNAAAEQETAKLQALKAEIAEQEAIDAAKAEAAAHRAAQEEADKAEADRIAELEKAAAIALQEEEDRIQAEKDKEAKEAAGAENARLAALEAQGSPNFESAAIVAVPFRDRANFAKEYAIGDDVSDFDEDRLVDLIEKGLVELQAK